MNTYMKLSVAAVCAALAAVTLRKQNADMAMLLGIVGCCCGGVLLLELLSPVLEFLKTLYQRTGMNGSLLSPLLKAVGIGFLTQFSTAICVDAGQTALAKVIELGGTVLCLCVSLPLMTAALSMIEQLAGG